MHGSQNFHDREAVDPNEANARIVQVDTHPQCDRKNDSVNRVKQRKPAACTTVSEAQQANADCGSPQKRRHDRNGQMSSRHSEVGRMQIDDLVERRQNYLHQFRIALSAFDRRPPHSFMQAAYLGE